MSAVSAHVSAKCLADCLKRPKKLLGRRATERERDREFFTFLSIEQLMSAVSAHVGAKCLADCLKRANKVFGGRAQRERTPKEEMRICPKILGEILPGKYVRFIIKLYLENDTILSSALS
jgi:hypothetical protein